MSATQTPKFLRKRNVLLLTGLLLLLSHLPFLNYPPQSQHVWRQCNTLAVARNFYEEDMNILRPRVDNRFNTEGVTGMQFPSYEFVVASVYHLTGEKMWVHRLFSLILYFMGAVFMYEFGVWLFRQEGWGAAALAWGFAWSPELFYHGINALPDVLALTASVGGLLYFGKWFQPRETNEGKPAHLLLSMVLLSLAGLTKLQYLAVGFPIAIMVLQHLSSIKTSRKWLELGLLGLVSVGLSLGWYKYAVDLQESSGLYDFGIELRPAESFGQAFNIVQQNLISYIPETILGYAATALFILGIVAALRGKVSTGWKWPLLAWMGGLIAYHLIELSQMEAHGYYMMPEIPALLIGVALGAKWLSGLGRWKPALYLLLAAMPILTLIRILPARWMNPKSNLPVEFLDPDQRNALIEAVPEGAYTVVGPDQSACIYFYFLDKKGANFRNPDKLTARMNNGKSRLELFVDQGAQYLYTYRDSGLDRPEVQKWLEAEIKQVGDFRVFKLKAP